MRFWARLLALLGAALAVALIVHEGVRPVFALLAQAGWVLLLLAPLHVAFLGLDVLGWRRLIAGGAALGDLLLISLVREAVNRLLPVVGVGGEIVGIRLLMLRGVAAATAAASVIVEVILTMVAVVVVALMGVVSLFALRGSIPASSALLAALVAMFASAVVLFLLLLHGAVFGRLARLITKSFGAAAALPEWLSRGRHLDLAIRRVLLNRRALLATLAWQVAGLLVACGETWFALHCLGADLSFSAAVAIEGLAGLLRQVAFFVPAELGVQEAGLMLLGSLVGVPADQALALSLAKRLRTLMLGVPALALWQWFEQQRPAMLRTGS